MSQNEYPKNLKPLPVGESDLDKILNNGFIYIDKTKHVYDLVKLPGKYFLSRPRRFGKSTLISTFYEIFRGNRDLFKDQWIYNSDYNWDEHPIIRVDFNASKDADIEYHIKDSLQIVANQYNIQVDWSIPYYVIFKHLIIELHQKYQRQVVVLIDEYDKPILDVIEDVELAEKKRDILKGFYGVMKGVDEHLRFVFLTGVTRFTKVGVFSGLNNLDDISMDVKYADLCGITQVELEDYFSDYIDQLAHTQELTHDECLAEIKRWYNGFYFSDNLSESLSVYNPFSTLLLFEKNKFTNYWFASGSSAFLIKLIKKSKMLYLENFDNRQMSVGGFDSFEIDKLNITAILYQAGYLTIKGYDKKTQIYTLGYTNYEIDKSFKESLLAGYSQDPDTNTLFHLVDSFNNNKLDDVIYCLKELFLNLEYDIKIDQENIFQNIIYLIFKLMGFYIKTEYKTHIGRIDAIVFHNDNVYVFEFKKNKTAHDAISQIHDRGYYKKYQNTGKNIYLIGMNYNTDIREIDDYLIEQL